jgi:hypothetical protein
MRAISQQTKETLSTYFEDFEELDYLRNLFWSDIK